MGQNAKEQILRIIFENPGKPFTVREIAKKSGVPRATAQRHLHEMNKKGLIDKKNRELDNEIFRIRKINYFLEKIADSGLITYLINELNPSCIILFGSIRKGLSGQESDIDLFIETPAKKQPKLTEYEKKLGHKIQLFTEPKITQLPEHLLNNVINGIKIYGGFSVKCLK